jgi:hypothetical protein
MKFNFPLTIVSIILTLTFGYYFFNVSNDILIVVGFVISSLLILGPSFIYVSTNKKISINIRVLSLIFYPIIIILSFVKMKDIVGDNLFILFSGVIIAIYILIIYGVNKTNV